MFENNTTKIFLLMIKANKIRELKNLLLVNHKKGEVSNQIKSCLYISSSKYKNYLLVEATSASVLNNIMPTAFFVKPTKEEVSFKLLEDMIKSLTKTETQEPFKIGEYVRVKKKNYFKFGKIQDIDLQNGRVVIAIVSLGSYMPVELPLSMISRVKQ
jgi:transcription antitermination factor NusG